MKEHILEGKTVTAVERTKDKHAIRFTTTEGQIVAKCDADCCSHTWIESIQLPVNGFPFTVTKVEDLDLYDKMERDGELKFYGLKLTTDKGDFVLDYRNESNGYYGGNLVWPDSDYFYGGVFDQNQVTEDWEPVTE